MYVVVSTKNVTVRYSFFTSLICPNKVSILRVLVRFDIKSPKVFVLHFHFVLSFMFLIPVTNEIEISYKSRELQVFGTEISIENGSERI